MSPRGSHPGIPATPTSLIGREEDVAGAKQRLLADRVRLLTFLGPPGIGKTRLAVEVAAEIGSMFPDGVFFVDLTTVDAAPLVMQAIARSFGLSDTTREPTTLRLQRYLQMKQTLVILDNFEHVIDAARDVSELLSACGELQIIATSREPLHLTWEQQFVVTPLGVPDFTEHHTAGVLMRFAAVRLFVERARAVVRDFVLSEDNARVVAEICMRLDGIPLAIELAAARVNILQPRDILDRLQQQLSLLTTGPRDAPARHQTLRDAIAWSDDLLTPNERILLRRLAVFVGGAGLEAIHQVCNSDGQVGADVLDGIGALANKHLVKKVMDGGEKPRFGLLKSLREFGLEQLKARGELADIQRAHAEFFLELAERAEPGLKGHVQPLIDSLEPDRSNLRAAIEWFLASGEAEKALRLTGAAHWLWGVQGYLLEIRYLLEKSLSAAGRAPSLPRWRALRGAATVAYLQGDLEAGAPLAAESLRLARTLGENEVACSLLTSGWIAGYSGDLDEAIAHFEEALQVSRALTDKTALCVTLCALAPPIRLRGDAQRAAALLNEGLGLARSLNDLYQTSVALVQLGTVALDDGRQEQAESLLKEALTYARQGNFQFLIIWVIEQLARALCARRDLVRAATLLGAADNLRERLAVVAVGPRRTDRERAIAAARTGLGEVAFRRGWGAGQAMSLAATIECALESENNPGSRSDLPKGPAGSKSSSTLSRREQEVATLVAHGETNRAIGATLGITEKTVGAHVQNIMNKLGFHSRSQIAAWTAAHGSDRTP